MSSLESYLLEKSNKRGNKNLNQIRSFFSDNDLTTLQNNTISLVGTNGKYSTIQAIRSILKSTNINCNIYTSPHIQKINERFVFNDDEISDDSLSSLLTEVENVNNGEQITYFEIFQFFFLR